MKLKPPKILGGTEVRIFTKPGVDQRRVSFWGRRSDTGQPAAFRIELHDLWLLRHGMRMAADNDDDLFRRRLHVDESPPYQGFPGTSQKA